METSVAQINIDVDHLRGGFPIGAFVPERKMRHFDSEQNSEFGVICSLMWIYDAQKHWGAIIHLHLSRVVQAPGLRAQYALPQTGYLHNRP